MVGASLASAARRWSKARRALLLVGLGSAVVGLTALWNSLLEEPGHTAPWAPGLGIVAAIALASRRRWRPAVAVLGSFAIGLGALLAGRSPEFALIASILVVVEVLVLCTVMNRYVGLPRFDSFRRTLMFLLASVLAATSFAAGLTLYRLLMGERSWDVLALDSLVSHLVSFLIVTPIGFVQWRSGARARPLEALVQGAVLVVTFVLVFSPLNELPLAFLILPVFAWAALRLASGALMLQLLLVAVASTVCTILGWGPFGATFDSARDSLALLQLYLAVYAGSTLVLSAKRVETEGVMDRAFAQDRALRRAVEQAQTAFLLIEPIGDAFVVLQANDHGLRALGLDPTNEFFSGSSDINVALPGDHPLIPGLRAVADGSASWRGELVLDALTGRADADVSMERGTGDDVIAVELTDVTAQRREDRRLRALVDRERALSAQYQELSRQKDDFVASISHELRTPLASIVGYAETLEETELDPMQRRFVDTITRNAGRLQERVEELLSAAKRAADSVDDPHPLALSPIIGDVVDDLRPVASARRVEVVIESSAAELPEIVGTEDAVTRVLTNIVGNAVKFSPDGAPVTISALVDDETVEVFVRDSGPGIAPVDHDRVFDRFYRTEDATAKATPGTGLGLSIVRTLLDAIGGSVLVESDGHSGSTFVLRFARSRDIDANS